MSNKKIINLATEDYVNDLVENIELTPGPAGESGADGKSAYQTALENGFEGTEEDWLLSLKGPQGEKGEDGKFDMNALYDILQTEDKTVIGAINELFALLKQLGEDGGNEEDPSALANVYYGYFPYTVNQELMNYADVKFEYLQHEDAVIEEAEGVLGKTSIGLVPEACFIVVAIKKDLGLVAKKDDGIGGLVDFDESVVGANNLEVEFEGEKYLLFGEYTIIDGERFIYVVEK